MNLIERELKGSEESYYESRESFRVFGYQVRELEQKLGEIFESSLGGLVNPPNLIMLTTTSSKTVQVALSELEEITDSEISTNVESSTKKVKFKFKFKDLNVELSVEPENANCKMVKVGKREVPIYELRCEED